MHPESRYFWPAPIVALCCAIGAGHVASPAVRRWHRLYRCFPAAFILAQGCGSVNHRSEKSRPIVTQVPASIQSGTSSHVRYTNVTKEAGIQFRLDNGARGEHRFIETTTGGCAFLDYNNDGFIDVLLVQAGPTPGSAGTGRPRCALYRNNGDGSFSDATTAARLSFNQGYAQCVAVADFDNDGWQDVYITAYGGNHLLHNNNGHFVDVTRAAGVSDNVNGSRWATSAAWGDYNNDGRLDLLVCHYAHWSPDRDTVCTNPQGARTYCSPLVYAPEHPTLFRNNGNGTFTDVTKRAGLEGLTGRGLSAVWLDYDGDGFQDVFVANDLTANFLLHNNGNGTFTNVALQAGVGVMDNGVALAGMGIAIGDYDNDGREDIVVTNFSNQPKVVYHNQGGRIFDNATYSSGIGSSSLLMLGWGCEFLDYDLDGYKDLLVANGHVNDDVEAYSEGIKYRQPKQLFHNRGDGTFEEDTVSLGSMSEPMVSRGLAIGDFDNDGAPDVLVNSHNGEAALYHNDGGNRNNWITFRTLGVRANRDGIGAAISIQSQSGRQYAVVRSGSSYGSHSDSRITFGLGASEIVKWLKIRWPGGREETVHDLKSRRFYVLTEGHGAAPDGRMKGFHSPLTQGAFERDQQR